MNYLVTLILLFVPGYALTRLDSAGHRSFFLTTAFAHLVSVFFLLLSGVLLNFFLPSFNIYTIFQSQQLIWTIFVTTFISYTFSFTIKKPQLKSQSHLNDFTNFNLRLFFGYLYLFIAPLLCILGTTYLENTNNNALLLLGIALIGIQAIATYFLSLRYKNKEAFLLTSLLTMGAGLILTNSLRGVYVTGSDIMTEFRMAQITQINGIWNPYSPTHPYNFCASITILPAVLSGITKIPLLTLFKSILHISTILSIIPVFFIVKKFANAKFSYITSIAYISFPAFFNIMPMHTRQEVAVFSFFCSIFILIDDHKSILRQFFFYIASSIMIVSHYSSTYIAGGIFVAQYILSLFIWLSFKIPILKKKIQIFSKSGNLFYFVNPLFIIFFFLLIYIWYFNITSLGVSATNFLGKFNNTITKSNDADTRDSTSFFNQLNIFYKDREKVTLGDSFYETQAEAYKEDQLTSKKYIEGIEIDTNNDKIIETSFLPPRINLVSIKWLLLALEVYKKLFKIFVLLGVGTVLLLFFYKKNFKFGINYIILLFSSIICMVIFTTFPNFTVDYDAFRVFHQLLIILAAPAVIGSAAIFSITKYKHYTTFSLFFFVIYLLISIEYPYQFIGNYPYSLTYSNNGDSYNLFYITQSEISATRWLERNKTDYIHLQTDPYAKRKINSISPKNILIYDELNKYKLLKESYVFLPPYSKNQHVVYESYRVRTIKHSLPLNSISENKNKIYSNRNAEIYK